MIYSVRESTQRETDDIIIQCFKRGQTPAVDGVGAGRAPKSRRTLLFARTAARYNIIQRVCVCIADHGDATRDMCDATRGDVCDAATRRRLRARLAAAADRRRRLTRPAARTRGVFADARPSGTAQRPAETPRQRGHRGRRRTFYRRRRRRARGRNTIIMIVICAQC